MAEKSGEIEISGRIPTPPPETLKETWSVAGLVQRVRCFVGNECSKAELASKTATDIGKIRREIREKNSPPSNLSRLREIQPRIGSESTTRLLLFGTGTDILQSHGTFASESDRKVYATFMEMPEGKRQQSPLFKKLEKSRGKTIEIPEKHEINFRKNLRELWERKLYGREDTKGKSRGYVEKNPALQKFYETRIRPVVESETPWKKMSLEGYEAEITRDIDGVKKIMGGSGEFQEKAAKAYRLGSKREIAIATKLMEQIGARELVILSMTEIMDDAWGEFNSELLEILLRNGGREYLLHIPALADRFVSFGPYQHTKYSVGGRIGEKAEAGANLADKAFTGGKVLTDSRGNPVTIENFPIELHHKAAYLLTLHNIASTIRKMPDVLEYVYTVPVVVKDSKGRKRKRFETRKTIRHPLGNLEKVLKSHPKLAASIMIQYFAAAHNNPKKSYDGLLDWLEAYETRWVKAGERLKPYVDAAKAPVAGKNAERARTNKDYQASKEATPFEIHTS